jgi:hypothetical protein
MRFELAHGRVHGRLNRAQGILCPLVTRLHELPAMVKGRCQETADPCAPVRHFIWPSAGPAPETRDEFTPSLLRLEEGDENAFVVPAGEHVLQPELDWCRQEIAHHLEDKDRGTSDVVEILAGGVRTVAKRSDSVGRGLLANSIPLAAVENDPPDGHFSVEMQAMSDERASFLQLHWDDRVEQATWEGPHLVCRGFLQAGAVMGFTREAVEARANERWGHRGFRSQTP